MTAFSRVIPLQLLLLLSFVLLFTEGPTPSLLRECCDQLSESVACHSGMSYVPEPLEPGQHRETTGYCEDNEAPWKDTTPDKITLLDLNGAQFTEIREVVFNYFPNLEKIKLRRNKFQTLKKNAFSIGGKPNNLLELHLQGNNISSVHPRAFAGLGKLKILYLDGNALTSSSIPNDAFDPLVSLTELRIVGNVLDEINVRWFKYLQNLEILSLSSNLIRILPQFSSTMKKLETIDISENEISEVKEKTFDELNKLEVIKLNKNKIRTIEEHAFRAQALVYIDISGNELSAIPKLAFDCLWNLRALILNDNQLTTAYPQWFASILINCDMYSGVYKDVVEPESIFDGNPWKCDEYMDEMAILMERCVLYPKRLLEKRRCAKRFRILCDGEQGKHLQDLRNNKTIPAKLYRSMNLTEDQTCKAFLPDCKTSAKGYQHQSPNPLNVKLPFIIAMAGVLLITLFVTVKYCKEKKTRKSEAVRLSPIGGSIRTSVSTHSFSISTQSDEETSPKRVFGAERSSLLEADTWNPGTTVPKEFFDTNRATPEPQNENYRYSTTDEFNKDSNSDLEGFTADEYVSMKPLDNEALRKMNNQTCLNTPENDASGPYEIPICGMQTTPGESPLGDPPFILETPPGPQFVPSVIYPGDTIRRELYRS